MRQTITLEKLTHVTFEQSSESLSVEGILDTCCSCCSVCFDEKSLSVEIVGLSPTSFRAAFASCSKIHSSSSKNVNKTLTTASVQRQLREYHKKLSKYEWPSERFLSIENCTYELHLNTVHAVGVRALLDAPCFYIRINNRYLFQLIPPSATALRRRTLRRSHLIKSVIIVLGSRPPSSMLMLADPTISLKSP